VSLHLRRGSVAVAEVPPGEEFGPTNGAQSVRDNAGPQTVADPGGGTLFTTADNATITSTIQNGAIGATYRFAAGTYNRTAATNVLDRNPTLIFLPGAIWNGNGGDFDGFDCTQDVGFTVKGGTFQNFGSATGANWPSGVRLRGPGLIEDGTFTDCHVGFAINGSNSTLRRNYCHANHRYGYAMSGTAAGVLIELNEITNNNVAHFNVGGDAGGAGKHGVTTAGVGVGGITIRKNWYHANYGAGLWIDGWRPASGSILIEDNVCENNRNWGIFYELSYGGAIIRRNAVLNNGVAAPTDPNNPESPSWFNAVQLEVSCSDGSLGPGSGIEISRNIVDGSERAMGLLNHDSHPSDCKGVTFQNNDVWLRDPAQISGSGGYLGGQDSQITKTLWTESTNRFLTNSYHVASLSTAYWKWGSGAGGGSEQTWAQWQAFGHDAAGSRVAI
jgi:parallel beta-helix repeat protein